MSSTQHSLTLEELWENLLNGFEHLFQFQTLRYSQWMLLYTHIFNHCSDKASNGSDLYEYLRNYLRNYLEDLSQSFIHLQEQDLLQSYINQCKKYRISSKILNGICSYLNRHYVRRENDSGNTDISEIYPMAMQIWREIFPRKVHTQITGICLNMINAHRNNEKMDTEIIKYIIQTYITIDFNELEFSSDDNSQMLDVYKECFEDQFLKDTQEFYRLEAIKYLKQYSVMEYISKIPQFYEEDIYRVRDCIHPSTIKHLVNIFKEVFISDQLETLLAEAKIFICEEKSQELNLLFQTVNQVANGKMKLQNMIEDHIYQIGIQTIEHIHPITNNDLKIYIQTIYNLHQKYSTFIEKAFDYDQDFMSTLDQACRKFINKNSVVGNIGNPTNMAEHLARYCDKLLRKGKKEEETDFEIIIDQIKILLYYIQEKDVFEKFYSKFLAKRLINQLSISNDYEKSMISNIQNICGIGCAIKMKQMCQDIETSKNTLDQYHRYCETEQFINRINFNVMILSANAWLFSIPSKTNLPNKLEFIVNNFNKFYNQLHNGRKLIWLHQHSKGELQTFFTDKIYTLQVSMYQMMILLLFNNSTELSIQTIHNETQIKSELLLQILNILIQSKILTSTGIDMNSMIKLSNDFTSEKYRINVNVPMKSVEQKDIEIFHKRIDQDRIMVIQATIVRIMKSHKVMNQNLLIQTVIQELNSYFNPNICIIKDCINSLINKEYLERQLNHHDVLHYMT